MDPVTERNMRVFLRAIAPYPDGVTPRGLDFPACTRMQQKVRRLSKVMGLVVYQDTRWFLTDKGREWIGEKTKCVSAA